MLSRRMTMGTRIVSSGGPEAREDRMVLTSAYVGGGVSWSDVGGGVSSDLENILVGELGCSV